MIVGFFGDCDYSFVDSIGAYFGPIPHPHPFSASGPIDGEAETWNDKKHMDIRQIDVVASSIVESISTVYDNYGHRLGPFTHGRAATGEKYTVSFSHFYIHMSVLF